MTVRTPQQARDLQARRIVEFWHAETPDATQAQILHALSRYSAENPHLAAHLITAVRKANLIPGF